MAYFKTVIKRLVVALCVLVLTGYVHACWVLARKLGEHEQVRMRPPSMRAYAQRGAPDQSGCVHPACVRTPSEAHRTRAACVHPACVRTPSEAHRTRAACVHPAKRTAALTTRILRTPLWLPQNGGSLAFNDMVRHPRTRSQGNKTAIVVLTSPSNVKNASEAWNYGVIERDHGGSAVAWAQEVVRRSGLICSMSATCVSPLVCTNLACAPADDEGQYNYEHMVVGQDALQIMENCWPLHGGLLDAGLRRTYARL